MLQIRNMESDRCISLVKDELCKLGFHYKSVELGKVEFKVNLSLDQLLIVDAALRNSGLEIMEEKQNLVIKNIKAAIYQLIYKSDGAPKIKLSDYLSRKVNFDYAYLSNLFSGIQGITIEKYFILMKIERVKELLIQGKESLSNISFIMQYSSVAHLSNQFKKITGMAPSVFSGRSNNKPITSNKV
jgi:AraC-like DNA-binding protein